jgi:hypothetical protein
VSTDTTETHTPVPGNNMLQRDREQAHLLHEPTHIYTRIDPITGHDIIVDRESHPHIEDGNVTFYFETEETRKAYLEMPIVEPFPKLPSQPSPEDDRGG